MVPEVGGVIEFELKDCNGINEIVKIFNQNYVIYWKNSSVYVFSQCSHQCICENCYANHFKAADST